MENEIKIIQESLTYDPISGLFKWNDDRPLEHFKSIAAYHSWKKMNAGKVICPSVYKSRYLRAQICQKTYYLHRLAFVFMEGRLPAGVDHLDGDKRNNRWVNLDEKVSAGNNLNKSLHKNNTSGVCGVSWSTKKGKWHVAGKLNGASVFLGLFDDLQLAKAVRQKWETDSGFTERHGK